MISGIRRGPWIVSFVDKGKVYLEQGQAQVLSDRKTEGQMNSSCPGDRTWRARRTGKRRSDVITQAWQICRENL